MKIIRFKWMSELWHYFVKHYPQLSARMMYFHIMRKRLNLHNPRDLNEKIQWLKFHSDLDFWAKLADKIAVRDYVTEKGLNDILIPLVGDGVYSSSSDLISSWDKLPKSFVIKTNNGCGTVKLIKDKDVVNLKNLASELDKWLAKDDIGYGTIEPHYCKIKPLLMTESLLEVTQSDSFSRSMIDYKIWCFNGKPYNVFVAYDRELHSKDHHVFFDTYDTEWKPVTHAMPGQHFIRLLEKPKNLQRMLDIASILSSGMPQARIDLYNQDGKIYFGEITLTSQGGYMDYFTEDYLMEMGQQIKLS